MAELAEKLMNIQRKINQVLRIRRQLESRMNKYTGMLGNANAEQLLDVLSSLANVLKRKKHVMDIVKKGVKEALKILVEAEAIVRKTQGFKKRLGQNILGQIPIIKKKYADSQPLIPLLNMMYSHLRKQFIYFEGKMDDIERVIKEQHTMILDLIIEVKEGKIVGNIYETSYYKEIMVLHNEEIEIIKTLGRESKSFTNKMVVVANKIQIRLSKNDMYLRHKKLAALQVKVQLTPIVSSGTTVTAFIAPPLVPMMYVALTLVNYSPTLAILGIEAAIRLKGPVQRAKEFTALKARVAKLGLRVPRTIFNEPQVPAFNQPPRRPAFAR